MLTVSILLTLGLFVLALPEIIFISAALIAIIKEKKKEKEKQNQQQESAQ